MEPYSVPAARGPWPVSTLLGRLDSTIAAELVAVGRRRTALAGEVLVSQGGQERTLILLLSGAAKVVATTESGHQALLAVRVGGDCVGEMGALDGAPRSATVTACGPMDLVVVTQAVLDTQLDRHPRLSLEFGRTIADRLRWANRRRLEFGGYPVKVRLARLLTELALEHGRRGPEGTRLPFRLTQPELAALTGAAETTVHKALRELRAEGLVETGYGATVLRRPERLRALAEEA
ncbi:Crp/Fnr family transcriptional regulator [Streptomyces sp. NPDC059499]|uniref:Crp/Fnr family transcriptional regulator n=1 Tax=Streptomyces sp. NPDC059499 TaxID=3346852 RepID=UPI00369469CE